MIVAFSTGYSQTLVNNGANIYVSPQSTITIVGNYLNLANGDINNAGEVNITGNWTNNAEAGNLLLGTSGVVTFNGPGTQTIDGTASTWFSNLKLEQETVLGTNISVSGILEMLNVHLNLNMSDIAMAQGAEILGATQQGYIVADAAGQLKQTVGAEEVFFPVGTNISFAPIALVNNGMEDQYGVSVFGDVLDGGLTGSTIDEIEDCVNLTWNIQDMVADGSELGINVFWNGLDEGSNFDRMHSGIGHFENGVWNPQPETEATGDDPFSITCSGITSTGAFAVGDLESPMTVTIGLIDQQIVITEGWSGISTYVDPANPNIEAIFQPIIDELIILQSETSMYWPGENVNTLGIWDAHSGFKIKVTSEVELTISGTMVENASVDISEGWNLVPVLSSSAIDVDELLLTAGVILAKEVAGNGVYWSEYNIKTLDEFVPGRSYFVLAENDATITYSDVGLKTTTINKPHSTIPSPWNEILRTPNSHIVVFQNEGASILQSGDVIGAFNKNGHCVGLTEYSNGETALMCYGVDGLTEDIIGLNTGEMISYRLFRPTVNLSYDIEVEYEQLYDYSGSFQNNGLSIVNAFKLNPMDVFSNSLTTINLYPNPTTGVIYIEGVENESEIVIYNSVGKVFYTSDNFHSGKIDMSGHPKGLYVVRISSNDGIIFRKFILD